VQNQVASTNAPGFSWSPLYDASGNMTDDGENAYLYDAEGRICAATDYLGIMTGYLYDAAGNRVAKGSLQNWGCDITTNGFQQTAGYVVDAGGQQLTEVDGSNNWKHTNIWAGGRQIGTYDAQGLHFYIDDPLGTRRGQVSATGTLEATYQSLPFGDGYNSIPYVTGAEDPTENHFTGKERDTESGNDYMFARYYNSATGRFLSPDWDAKSSDPVPYAKLDNPQSLNLYSYVGNNPLSRADADGHFWNELWNDLSTGCACWTTNRAQAVSIGTARMLQRPNADLIVPFEIEGIGLRPQEAPSMRAGQREAMRQEGIPTSQQPTTQQNTAAGKQYTYEVPKEGGGTETKVVQRNNGTDSSHPGEPHVEAGRVKPGDPTPTDSIGRPRLKYDKTKVDVKKPDGN
jgi:RHS repeat-associated protein